MVEVEPCTTNAAPSRMCCASEKPSSRTPGLPSKSNSATNMPQQTQAEKRADATDTISDDILDRIFNHLEPGPKELVAFELVCKKWGAAGVPQTTSILVPKS